MKNNKRLLNDIYWVKFIGAILFVLCIVLILGYYVNTGIPLKEALFQVVLALFTTLISILIVGLAYQKITEGEFNKSIRENIFDSLSADSSIIKEYKDNKVKYILCNCFSVFYGDTLSKEYMNNVVEKQLDNVNYRQDFSYNIEICPSEQENNDQIIQNLSYKRFFPNTQTDIMMQCCFALSENGLNAQFENKKLFFREELNCDIFKKLILDSNSTHEILEKLNLKMFIDGHMVDHSKITHEFSEDKSSLLISTPVPKEAIGEDTGFNFYKGSVDCSYPTVKNDFFYCVFSEPIMNARFTIKFRNGVAVENVKYFSFIPKGKYTLNRNTNKHYNNISFESTETLFPLSGIVFHW